MRKLLMAGMVAAASLVATSASNAQTRVEVGVLTCDVSGGSGFIFGSTKTLDCVFERAEGADERYRGDISKFGIDIGTTTRGGMVWAVFAPTSDIVAGALNGNYAGVSGEATVGVGVGANALIGGSSRSIVLQPVSISGQEGLNIAVGIAEMRLTDTY
ncbi:DUF992 domain-containing protein [Tepidamorphus sp. 3E244]|uniref:DUF992 domain-containing protein n=1 Tax=Tepidamorphus sp. 3E244 TaxID=3385498 RepID=UPI0038FC3871